MRRDLSEGVQPVSMEFRTEQAAVAFGGIGNPDEKSVRKTALRTRRMRLSPLFPLPSALMPISMSLRRVPRTRWSAQQP